MSGLSLYLTDSQGNIEWNKFIGINQYSDGNSIQQTTDEGYIITGSKEYQSPVGSDILLIKTDSNGDQVWEKTFSGSVNGGFGMGMGYSVEQTLDGGFIITGFHDGGIFHLIKTDSEGNIENN